ncbi:DNA/RNA polymerases superfamily protein [Tanacetum coccineum]|uniref:DNA/RNA polymerases superfamily protein n=1 Tax=Tanacetum coccineum TaxID=301880 RepID=A0ABQ4ZH95_9ASTR
MTRSSRKKLVKPFDEPEQAFHSLRRLFKTPSFDHSNPLGFELFFDHKDQFEEEITETIGEPTMEEYMTKTREEYGSGIARPKFDKDFKFERKGQFLKELYDNTFSGLDVPTRQILDSKEAVPKISAVDAKKASNKYAIQAQQNNLGREIKKVNEKVYAAQVRCELCNGPHYTKDCPLKEEGKMLEEAYYTQFGLLFRQTKSEEAEMPSIRRIRSNRYVVSTLQKNDNMPLIKLTHATIPFPGHLKEYSDDEKEDRAGNKAKMNEHCSTIAKDPLPPKEKDLGSFTLPCTINNVCFDKALADLEASVSVMPYSTFINLGLEKLAPTKLIIELADKIMKRPKGIAVNVLVGIDKFVFPIDFIVLDMPEDTKIPLILRGPFLSTAHAKIDVFKRKFALRIGNEKILFKSDSPTSNIIKKVYALGLRERMEHDLEARLMGEALILNRSKDPKFGGFIKLNDLNEPLELRNHETEDLGPTIEKREVIDKPKAYIVKTRNDDMIIEDIDEYPILSINVMSKNFSNSIMKDKVEYKGKNVVGAFINIPIFVGKFSIVTDFAVVENMDAYRYKDMGDVIVERQFCRDSCVEARWLDGFITIHNGNDSVTYQMARSHQRFKHLSNEQCNKIRLILKTFGRNTRDLGSILEEIGQEYDFTLKEGSKNKSQMVETTSGKLVTPSGSASDRVRKIVTASELSHHNETLEDSMARRRQDSLRRRRDYPNNIAS